MFVAMLLQMLQQGHIFPLEFSPDWSYCIPSIVTALFDRFKYQFQSSFLNSWMSFLYILSKYILNVSPSVRVL